MIKGISEVRRIPRLGKIRLGVKAKSAQGTEYPKEVDYFLLDPDVPDPKRREELLKQFKDLYGEKPKVIKIMFPPASPELFFAQFYKRYGSGALLKCKGDGEVAETIPEFAEGLEKIGETERGFIQVKCLGPECPYQNGPKKQCGRMASLQVILPELSGIGIWQINTGSYNSIVNINSAIEWLTGLCGRYAMIPIKLMRQEQDIAYEGKRSKHYILAIDQNISIGAIQSFASLKSVETALIPAPDDKKDDLFYDHNGNRPQLTGPTEEASVRAEEKKPAPAKKAAPKGPIAAAFEKEQEKKEEIEHIKQELKELNTKDEVKGYCEVLKATGKIDKFSEEQKNELREWIRNHMENLKK